jgi:hypothetical protein
VLTYDAVKLDRYLLKFQRNLLPETYFLKTEAAGSIWDSTSGELLFLSDAAEI